MRILFASDIHGSLYYAKELERVLKEQQVDQIVLLGDLLYHGPRNPLTKDYNPIEVANILNRYKDKIIAVRGNCDSEVDQMVLEFSITADYTVLYVDGHKIFVTHGHLYNEDQLPLLNSGDSIIYGHFHTPLAKEVNGIYVLNPGSTSLPKSDTNSYALLDNGIYTVKDFMGNIIKSIELKSK